MLLVSRLSNTIIARHFLRGENLSKKLTWDEVLQKCQEVHGDCYSYEGPYTGGKGKLTIWCKIHGEFHQTFLAHYHQAQGCPKCGELKCRKSKTKTIERFILQAREVHGDTYDYPGSYRGIQKKIKIMCPVHGEFDQIALNHINGASCPSCAAQQRAEHLTAHVDSVLAKFKEVHGDRYDYSRVDYTGTKKHIEIICRRHGSFLQRAADHMQGCGCPRCHQSLGEVKVERWLEVNGVLFERQKKFSDCVHKRPLPFDFYLTQSNILIEYDGEQHFVPVKFSSWSSKVQKEKFELIRIKDEIKTNYAKLKGVPLLRIPFNGDVNHYLSVILPLLTSNAQRLVAPVFD